MTSKSPAQYDALDRAIVAAIQGGRTNFTSIAYGEDIQALAKPHSLSPDPFRVVDRRLQYLRKHRRITYFGGKWSVVNDR